MRHPIISSGTVTADNNIDIDTYILDEDYSCGLIVEAGTTGFKGGDSGHGCRTYFRLEAPEGCDFILTEKKILPSMSEYGGGFSIIAGGDWELHQLITGLKFAVKVLEDQSKQKA